MAGAVRGFLADGSHIWMEVTSCVRARFLSAPAWLAPIVSDFAIFVLPGGEDCDVWALPAWVAPVMSAFVLVGQVDCAVFSMPAWLAPIVSAFVLLGRTDCNVWPLPTWLAPVAV